MRSLSHSNPRLAGLLLILIGAGLLYWLAWLPVQAALIGSRSVPVSGKGVIVGTVAVIAGLLQVVFGPLVLPVLHPLPGESRVPAYLSGVVIIAMGFGAYFALKSYLAGLGYTLP